MRSLSKLCNTYLILGDRINSWLFRCRDIHPQSWYSGQNCPKWCVKIESYLGNLISKIWFDIQNLRYFLSDCPTIILWHFVFRVQICDKTWYFSCIFGWFLVNILTTPFEQYWSNLDKSETKGYKAGAEGSMVEFSVISVKIDQIRPKLCNG